MSGMSLLGRAATAAMLVVAICSASGRRDEEEPEQWQSWQSDVTDSMDIGPSLSGYKHVSLHCGADHMLVELEMEENFDGVIYTRGAFHGREAPCFLDAAGGHNFTLRLPFTSCNTRKVDGGMYSNTVVVQYDDELIMPGDAAFKLECNLKNPTEYIVTAGLNPESGIISSHISLEDADPAAQDTKKTEHLKASSDSSTVHFSPLSAKLNPKDEL